MNLRHVYKDMKLNFPAEQSLSVSKILFRRIDLASLKVGFKQICFLTIVAIDKLNELFASDNSTNWNVQMNTNNWRSQRNENFDELVTTSITTTSRGKFDKICQKR